MEEQEQTRESAWNLAQSNIFLVGQLQREALYNYNKGFPQKSFFKFKTIRFVVGSRFEDEEIETLKTIEKKFLESKANNFGNYYFYLDKYIEELNKLFRKYKLDISDKEKKYRLG